MHLTLSYLQCWREKERQRLTKKTKTERTQHSSPTPHRPTHQKIHRSIIHTCFHCIKTYALPVYIFKDVSHHHCDSWSFSRLVSTINNSMSNTHWTSSQCLPALIINSRSHNTQGKAPIPFLLITGYKNITGFTD